MIWYLLVATFLFVGYFASNPGKYYKISMVVLFVFTAFRNIYLGDYENRTYISGFNKAPLLSDFIGASYDYETGYTLLYSICKTIVNDFRFFQVIYTAIAIILLYFVIKNLKLADEEKNLFLFVYFCMRFVINNFIILRQNLANLLIWNVALADVGIVVTLIVVVLSSQFHVTSLANVITLPGLRALKKVDMKKVFIGTLIASVVLLIASDSVINRLVTILYSLTSEKYQKYLLSAEGASQGFNAVYYVLRLVFYILFYLFYDEVENERKDKIFLISSFAVVFGSVNVAIFSRFMEFFMVGIYAEITLSYKAFTEKSRGLYLVCLYVAMMVILYRQISTYGGGFMVDYFWFFNQG